MNRPISILRKTKRALPRLPFSSMKEAVLGKSYELSLVFVENKTSHALNRRYRGKNKPTNVLSFPLSKNSGEILIDVKKTKKEAAELNESFREYLKFIFIHGLLHLKGMDH